MFERLNLKELGERLKAADRLLMELLARRNELARAVEAWKRRTGDPIFRGEIERQRLDQMRVWAKELGLNPDFAQAMLYLIIGESCKEQIIQLQNSGGKAEDYDEEGWNIHLKKNLLTLTEEWASTYDGYGDGRTATRMYLNYERKVLDPVMGPMESKKRAIDLGCATGGMTRWLAGHFRSVIGYDISPHMIACAAEKAATDPLSSKLSFETVDLEEGIPEEDGGVSFAVMNMGTAGDFRRIDKVVLELERVLEPGGKAFLSFYNRKALLYRWKFLPWEVGLAAEINLQMDCLEVVSKGRSLPIYARAYAPEEIRRLFGPRLRLTALTTYPTVAAVLPNHLLDEEEVRTAVDAIDWDLSSQDLGAYAVAMVRKG